MGINYYAIKKLPRSIKGKICEFIENDLYDEAIQLFDTNFEKVHLGKCSAGWKFLFNYNNFKYYNLNKESIDKFLRGDDIILYNEYNEEVSIDDFWRMIENSNDKLDNKTYYKDKECLPFMLLEEHVPSDLKDKYDVECYEFYSDGLRFSSSTDFS